MNILDENIPENQRQLLQGWRVSIRQIGYDIGRKGMQDDEIIAFLQQLRRPTFFTRDLGFYDRDLRHKRYGLICLAVDKHEAAIFARRLLGHRAFNTQAKRMGAVIRASHAGLSVWRIHAEKETHVDWIS